MASSWVIDTVMYFFRDIRNLQPSGRQHSQHSSPDYGSYKRSSLLNVFVYFSEYFPPVLIYLFACLYFQWRLAFNEKYFFPMCAFLFTDTFGKLFQDLMFAFVLWTNSCTLSHQQFPLSFLFLFLLLFLFLAANLLQQLHSALTISTNSVQFKQFVFSEAIYMLLMKMLAFDFIVILNIRQQFEQWK